MLVITMGLHSLMSVGPTVVCDVCAMTVTMMFGIDDGQDDRAEASICDSARYTLARLIPMTAATSLGFIR